MKIKLFLLLIIFSFKISAQEELMDKFSYKANYQLEYQEDSTDENSIKSETVVLYLGEGHSRYSSLGKAIKDSLEHMPDPLTVTMGEYNQMTDFKYSIYKNYKENQLILAEKVFEYTFKYKQELKSIDWEIQQEKKKF